MASGSAMTSGSAKIGSRVKISGIGALKQAGWSRGAAGRATPESLLRSMHRWWLIALLFKLLGSSWDVSWHFKWLRDELAPPHLLNTIGTVLAVGLVLVHTYTGFGVDRAALKLMQWGTGIFLLAIPIDLINHRVNGLDITAWSPSHALLYLGTALIIAGAIRSWYLLAPVETPAQSPAQSLVRDQGRSQNRSRALGLGALWFFFMENVLFPAQHQEYGVLEIASWDRGKPYAEPTLLKFAADQIGRPVDRTALVHFALPVPSWLYPFWMVAAVILVLVIGRIMIGSRWTATAVAAGYVTYRCLIWPLLAVTGFPHSAVPVFLVPAGLAVDLVFLGFAVRGLSRLPRWSRAGLGAVVVTTVSLTALWVQSELLAAPPSAYRVAAPMAAVLLAAGWYLADTQFAPAVRRGA
jgi:hypothetical protein